MLKYQIKNNKHLLPKALKKSVKCVFFPKGNKKFAVGKNNIKQSVIQTVNETQTSFAERA